MPFAFRCVNCNSLAESAHAGELEKPAKCSTCGAGVSFTPDGIKSYHPDNWVVLSDLEGHALDKVLKYHAITEDDIEVHVPTPAENPDHEPVNIDVEAVDETGQKDKAAAK